MDIMNIVYAGGVLAILGIAFGAVLVFAEKKFAVEEDPRVTQVRACLAGANCGACGYPGCDGYAMAVVAGEAPVNACAPGGAKTAAAIAAVMGAEPVETGPAKKARVLCQGTVGCAKEKAETQAYASCAAAAKAGGNKLCSFACLGIGDCVKACKFEALSLVDGIAQVNEEKCVGCGACEKACPRSAIRLMNEGMRAVVRCRNTEAGKEVRAVCGKGCLACGMCVKACEHGAIAVKDGYAQIDYEKCENCGACAKACKFGVISF